MALNLFLWYFIIDKCMSEKKISCFAINFIKSLKNLKIHLSSDYQNSICQTSHSFSLKYDESFGFPPKLLYVSLSAAL